MAGVVPGGNKSVLMVPDPYHNPGYGGYCPQLKFQAGETYGRATHNLLVNNNVASSGNLVLTDLYKTGNPTLALRKERAQVMRSRTESWGDQKLTEHMIPGYTGFVPKEQHYFGDRYALNCQSAVADFVTDQRKHKQKMQGLHDIEAIQSGRALPSNTSQLPSMLGGRRSQLKPIAKEAQLYTSRTNHHLLQSPYTMSNDNPDKFFMSGFTGFIPRERSLLGSGYPCTTNTALIKFNNELAHKALVDTYPFQLHRKPTGPTEPRNYLYPSNSGLIPHYTGHIPGEKFKYGNTFGFSTENARANMTKPVVV